jgi:uncharacterized protein YhfF
MEIKQPELVNQFWRRFIEYHKMNPNTTYLSVFHFELTERVANELLELVLVGKKKATASSLKAFEICNEPLPNVDDLHIITDWKGYPHCVIQTKAVMILPYKDMTYEICKREGEDDSLESWQLGHKRFFVEEGKELGYKFSEDLQIVFEDFEVIYKEQQN